LSLSFSCSFCFGFELFLALLAILLDLPLFVPFVSLMVFFLFLDDLLKIFLAFSLLAVLHWVLDSKFKICVFMLSIDLARGRLRNQVVSSLV
jgi:hypothetical protein